MDTFMTICTIVGVCYVAGFLLKVAGKIICWVLGGVIAIVGAVILGSFALVGVYILAILAFIVVSVLGSLF